MTDSWCGDATFYCFNAVTSADCIAMGENKCKWDDVAGLGCIPELSSCYLILDSNECSNSPECSWDFSVCMPNTDTILDCAMLTTKDTCEQKRDCAWYTNSDDFGTFPPGPTGTLPPISSEGGSSPTLLT